MRPLTAHLVKSETVYIVIRALLSNRKIIVVAPPYAMRTSQNPVNLLLWNQIRLIRKRSFALLPSSEIASQSKKGKTDFGRFLDENTASTIPALSKDELVSRLLTAVGFLHYFSNVSQTVATLDDKVLKLTTSLDEKNDLICDLGEEIVNNKVSFANSILKLNQYPVSSPTCVSGQTYASVARSSLPGAVLVAKCVDGGSSAVLDVHSVEKLLDTPNSGLIPSHVRYKNHRVYVKLDNEADVAKAAAILNSKPDFQSNFDPASKLNVLFPVISLFVNISDPE